MGDYTRREVADDLTEVAWDLYGQATTLTNVGQTMLVTDAYGDVEPWAAFVRAVDEAARQLRLAVDLLAGVPEDPS